MTKDSLRKKWFSVWDPEIKVCSLEFCRRAEDLLPFPYTEDFKKRPKLFKGYRDS